MSYPDLLVQPMRDELTRIGFQELRTSEDVDRALTGEEPTLVVVNSVCGCAAGSMRPGVAMAVQQGDPAPTQLTTVFAGQDKEATEKARTYFAGYPPSSPSIGLVKDGQLLYFMERHQIEGRTHDQIAGDLREAFQKHCA